MPFHYHLQQLSPIIANFSPIVGRPHRIIIYQKPHESRFLDGQQTGEKITGLLSKKN